MVHRGLFRMDLNGGQVEEIPLPFTEDMYASDWSRDGKYALTQNNGGRMYAIPLSGDRKPLPLLEARRFVDQERFSPDVQWIAYNTNDSGRYEVFVMPFLHPGPTIQVSNNGGMQPRWRRDGKELFYLDYEGRIMSVAIQPGNPPTFGAPRPLFKTRLALTASIEQYDVTADGQRLVMLVPTHDPPPATLNVALNWQNAARR